MAGTLPVDYPFLKEDGYTDTILIIQGRKLFLNKCLLGYASSHFQRLFSNAHKSTPTTDKSDKRKKTEIKIVDKNFDDFVELLAFYHPGVLKDLTEKTALRLLPLAQDYNMTSLKLRCESLLTSSLKKLVITSSTVPKGTPVYKNRKDNAPELLLQCTVAADAANSKPILEQCIRIWSNPEVPIKELKSTPDISDPIKARIYENRMARESKRLQSVTNELEKEKNQNEQLQQQLLERLGQTSKGKSTGRIKRYGSDPALHTTVQPVQSQTSPTHNRRLNQKYNSGSKDFKKYGR